MVSGTNLLPSVRRSPTENKKRTWKYERNNRGNWLFCQGLWARGKLYWMYCFPLPARYVLPLGRWVPRRSVTWWRGGGFPHPVAVAGDGGVLEQDCPVDTGLLLGTLHEDLAFAVAVEDVRAARVPLLLLLRGLPPHQVDHLGGRLDLEQVARDLPGGGLGRGRVGEGEGEADHNISWCCTPLWGDWVR